MNVPQWAKDAVFYQIFPDRFARSSAVPKPENIQPWGERPSPHHFQGGDLLGIVEHLDYLVDLGVNALYLNPIFQSTSNHRYHTHDYYRVDPILGGDDALRTLIQAAHKRDVRVLLDGVFNHASRGFFQFNDILENGTASPWLNWFKVTDWPLSPYDMGRPANYESWWNQRQLPNFNTDNNEVREFLMGVAEYWIEAFDIDGWRLDVPADIQTEGFWEEFRRRVKAINPETYLVGEIWHEAPEWLTGDRFDALMNYPLSEAIIAFVAGNLVPPPLLESMAFKPYPRLTGLAFGQRLEHLMQVYDWETTQVQFNLVGSHDTPRLLNLVRHDETAVELALLLQMTLPGAPCVYYGDEIGIRGTDDYDSSFRDSDSRWAFPWHDQSSWNMKLLDYSKTAINLRRRHQVLRSGSFSEVYAADYCFVFSRNEGADWLVIALNAGHSAAAMKLDLKRYSPAGSSVAPVFGSPASGHSYIEGLLSFEIPARSGIVFGPSS